MESLILYGGTFDPVHNGHLRIARAASLTLNADVIFIPNANPPGKKPIACFSDRLEMLKDALKEDGSASFSISLFESELTTEPHYWIDTLRYFKNRYPKRKLFFIIGADEANQFLSWKSPDEISKLATPIYVPRAGIEVQDALLQKYRMWRLSYEKSGEVSSSEVRRLHSLDIPLSVRNNIEKKHLYYINDISKMLSAHRLLHSISVARLAYEIAYRNHLRNPKFAYIAGLLHDIGKDVPKEKEVSFMKEHFPEQDQFPEWTYHQFIGAEIAKEKFGIEQEEILDAIRCHATGKPHMTRLAKIIYSSDKIDPLRGYDSSKLIKACIKDCYQGFIRVLEANKIYLEGKGYRIDNPMTEACMKLYLGGK